MCKIYLKQIINIAICVEYYSNISAFQKSICKAGNVANKMWFVSLYIYKLYLTSAQKSVPST